MSTTSVTKIIGQKVIAVDTAEDVGEVKSVILNRSASKVERIQVAGRKRSPELVDWRHVESVGTDAVMVRSVENVHDSRDDEPDDLYVRGDIEVIGAPVLDTGGFGQGTLTDVHFDADSGAVSAAMTDNGRIESARIRSLGTFAMVVEAS